MFKWFLLIAACFLVVMYVEEVPAQEMVIIDTPTTVVVCVEVSPGIISCS